MNAVFAHALLHPEQPCPSGLRVHNGSDPAVRLAVYRNNVVSSLIDALRDGFPVTRQLVGDEFFAALARVFVLDQPPSSPVLGAGLRLARVMAERPARGLRSTL